METPTGPPATPTGLREQKKQRARRHLAATALRLFLAHGFDAVSVADVAAAAEVSKPTLFRYFPTKEDLVLDRFADHQGEAARVVLARDGGRTPLRALHDHFQAGLRERDPITGLNDEPEVVAFQHLLYGTPGLQTRLTHYTAGEVELLTDAVADAYGDGRLGARLAALHLVTVRQELGRENWRRIAAGAGAAAAYEEAAADAERAFGVLERGLGAR
ncbi:TetR family transcriptional regulator [Kitasatospora sp. NBC_01287]|uniref:TetR/AcrR family transcriptional regulator n=1 Tax=Kitasatospora sp. NBC_01287 TaxID=2903573 RepID=UPI002253713F|nr:TetR family transcriptional regulator [Kitasatospora sp. NBC_01287]MCX4748914.1 TetR family transcriptional regulator [Kitasatospora sp. NBC_01287]